MPINKPNSYKSKNRTQRQEMGRAASNIAIQGSVVAKSVKPSNSIRSMKSVIRVFHTLQSSTCGTYITAATKIPMVFSPAVSIINTYDRYLVRSVKAHIVPFNTSTGGAMCVAYDATKQTTGYNDTARLLDLSTAVVGAFSQASPEIISLTVKEPAFTIEGEPDLLRYEPVGTGVAWAAGDLFVGSMSQANTFTVWFEWEVELIAPRLI